MIVRRLYIALLAMLALLPLALAPGAAAAQTDQQCFPQTGLCIAGPILSYWRANGGLPAFGYPITAQRVETVEGRTIPVQWFERDRLEIQNDGTITAGRLGARLLELQNRPWQNFPAERPINSAECRYFAETRHNVCGWFLGYWERNGGLQRFGYPISPAKDELIEGRQYHVQYFERRRMEYHPENTYPYDVLLGLLGREVYALEGGASACQPAVPPLADLARRLESTIGCPSAGARSGVPIATQPFEHGEMLWVRSEDVTGGTIFVIFDDPYAATGRSYRVFTDTYVEGEPVNTDILPPPGLYVPVRGFGKLWRDNEWVRGVLGFGTAPEQGDIGAIQPFQNGQGQIVHRARTDTGVVFFPLKYSGAGDVAVYPAH